MQRVHFQVGVGVFNCQQILKQRFLSFSLMLWYKTNRMWLSVVCNLIDNDRGHHSRQNLLWNHWFIHACRHKQNFHGNLNGFLVTFSTIFTSYLWRVSFRTFVACLVFLGMAFSFIKLISSSDTLTTREAAILKICPPAIITSAEVIMAEYDAILGQWERENFYNHLSNYTNISYPTRARRIIVKYTKDSTSFPGSKMRDPGNEVVKDFVEEEKRQMLDKFSWARNIFTSATAIGWNKWIWQD